MKFSVLDVVCTKFGTICVVSAVSGNRMALTLPEGSTEVSAWYESDELEYIGSLNNIVGELESRRQLARECAE